MPATMHFPEAKFSQDQTATKARAYRRFIAAEMVGYYGLLSAAAIGAMLLH